MRCSSERLMLLLAAAALGGHAAAVVTTMSHMSGPSLAGLLSDLPNLGDLVDSSTLVLTELIKTLKSGQTVQSDIRRLLMVRARTVARRSSTRQATANQTADLTCPSLAVLFARGTAEPGNVGFLTGPPFFTALKNYVETNVKNDSGVVAHVAVQGIDYAATIGSFLAGGSPFGGAEMARMALATSAACPSAKLVLAGYSQGAQVVRLAAQRLAVNRTNSTAGGLGTPAISSVVLFGDPMNGTAVAGVVPGRVLTVCHAHDVICEGGDLVLPAHLNYSGDAAAAAMFVMQRSGLGMVSADAMMQGMGNVPTMANPTPKSRKR